MAGAVKGAKLKVQMLQMQPHLKEIESQMKAYVQSTNGCRLLEEVCTEFFSSGGKRFRPTLCLLSCSALGGNMDAAVKVAVASELFHSMSLIHDDIIDDDATRRGRPTVHVAHGLETAILSGDYLLAKAFEALCDCATHLPPSNFERVVRLFSTTCTQACAGEIFDVNFDYSRGLDYYHKVIECKTAGLIVMNLQVGALCADPSEEEMNAFAAFGYQLGMSFQIMDDVIGLISSEEELGKTVGLDITRGRPNIVTIMAAQRDEEMAEMLRSGLQLSDVHIAIKRCRELGCIDEAMAMACEANRWAKQELRDLRPSASKDMLFELADYVLERRK